MRSKFIYLLLVIPFLYCADCYKSKDDFCKRKLWFTNRSDERVVAAHLQENAVGKYLLTGPLLDSGRTSGDCVGDLKNDSTKYDLYILDSASFYTNAGNSFQRDSILFKYTVLHHFSMTLADMRAVDFHISYP